MTAPGAVVAAVSRRADYLSIFTIAADGQVWSDVLGQHRLPRRRATRSLRLPSRSRA